jgi:pimeloyl-ACP methyl ester carboxylesterase
MTQKFVEGRPEVGTRAALLRGSHRRGVVRWWRRSGIAPLLVACIAFLAFSLLPYATLDVAQARTEIGRTGGRRRGVNLHTRRNVLRTAGFAAAGAAATVGVVTANAATTSSAPPEPAGPPNGAPSMVNFVCVHTTNASSAWWAGLGTRLGVLGHRTITVDLPGHGAQAYFPLAYQHQDIDALASEPSPTAELILQDYVAHVVDIVRKVRVHGRVVLVGHGDGGATVSLVADAVPELIDHIVYLAGCCCVELPTMSDYFHTPENADAVAVPLAADPTVLGVSRINWRSGTDSDLSAFRSALAASHSDAEFRAMLNSLQPDEPAAVWATDARGHRQGWGTVPRTYVRFSEDRTVTPALQDRFIAEADALTPENRFMTATVAAPHAGPLHIPEIVDVLHTIATES